MSLCEWVEHFKMMTWKLKFGRDMPSQTWTYGTIKFWTGELHINHKDLESFLGQGTPNPTTLMYGEYYGPQYWAFFHTTNSGANIVDAHYLLTHDI